MKARAGMGIDRLSPLDFERLPDCAIEDLVNLFSAIEASLTWPWQSLIVIGRLLAKKSGGDRVIGLVAMLCRVWSLAREFHAKAWASDTSPSWDAAVA
eukprot:337208-Pyramimonas_sp.AAC.1